MAAKRIITNEEIESRTNMFTASITNPVKVTYVFLPNEIYGCEYKEQIFYDNNEYVTALTLFKNEPNKYKLIGVEQVMLNVGDYTYMNRYEVTDTIKEVLGL